VNNWAIVLHLLMRAGDDGAAIVVGGESVNVINVKAGGRWVLVKLG
jgi:hypothetical protein